jgi:hypothetical protein
LCAEWQPDLLVRDEIDFGCVVIAERLGLPYATVLVIAAGSFVWHSLVTEPLNQLRAEHGLPPDPNLAMLSRYLVLSPCPPNYRDPAFPRFLLTWSLLDILLRNASGLYTQRVPVALLAGMASRPPAPLQMRLYQDCGTDS